MSGSQMHRRRATVVTSLARGRAGTAARRIAGAAPNTAANAVSSTISRTIALALAITLALTLGGCGMLEPYGGDNSGGNSISSFRIPMSAALRPYYTQTIEWTDCRKPNKCGYVDAPLDWKNPGGKKIRLALIKHPATGQRVGTLLVNPGGPGASGVEMVAGGVGNAVDTVVAKRFDIVGFDPRGVGKSTAVKCGGSKTLDQYLYGSVPGEIGSPQWIAGEKAKSRALANACTNATGSLLAHIDSVSSARDIDIIRTALKQTKLNFLGYSYGTELGTLYAGLYPRNVGRFVFDGPYNPWYGSDTGAGTQAVSFDDSLDTYLKSCIANTPEAVGKAHCPFTGTYADAAKSVSSMLTTAATHPLRAADGRELNAQTLSTGISEAMYDTESWPDITTAFAELQRGVTTEAFTLADEYNDRNSDGTYSDNLNEASLAIECLESGPSIDLKGDAKELVALKKEAPIMGPYEGYLDLGCYGWPYGPTPFPDAVYATGAPPILLIATTGDPATPYGSAKALAVQLDSGRLITFHGEGHTAYALGNICVNRVVDNFFISGAVPDSDPNCR